MIIKFHRAKCENQQFVELWGTGKPLREFLYIDDMAEACLWLMQNYESSELINIGSGNEISIRKLAEIIREVVGFQGEIRFDAAKPDGTPRRVLDNSKIRNRLETKVDMKEGIRREYEYYLSVGDSSAK